MQSPNYFQKNTILSYIENYHDSCNVYQQQAVYFIYHLLTRSPNFGQSYLATVINFKNT